MTDILDRLSKAQYELREAKRYVRTEGLNDMIRRMGSLQDLLFRLEGVNAGTRQEMTRLRRNIEEGYYFSAVQPSVLEGYLEGAAFELGVIANRLRKESEALNACEAGC